MAEWRPLHRDAAHELLADLIAGHPGQDGLVRVAVDGAPSTGPDQFTGALIAPLKACGRPVVHVRAQMFWRDASVRLEHGHEDLQSYPDWLDVDALRREVLEPAAAAGTYLPSLRDPETDRSTRATTRPLEPSSVLIVSGSFLLGRGLPFERTVHLHAAADQLARDTPPEQRWTLPAYAAYDAGVVPVQAADVVIRTGRRSTAVLGL